MKNVLITGGAGFIGSHLVDRLIAEKEWNVTVLDDFNHSYSPVIKYHNIAKHTDKPSFSLVGGDIASKDVLKSLFSNRNFDCIVHLADRTGVYPSFSEPQSYERTNVQGTLNLLEAAQSYGTGKFIFGSSASVYGDDLKTLLNEEMAVNKPHSPYATTKTVGEMLCHTFTQLYGIHCVSLRFFTVYGPRQRPDTAIYKFTRQIENGEPVTLHGDGSARRDYVYITDVLNGIRAAMDYDETVFEIINLGSGKSVSLIEIVKLLEKKLRRKAVIKHLPVPAGLVRETLGDIQKARNLLFYEPEVSIEKGIGEFVRWYRKERRTNVVIS
jgi:UDP-glucuronate 4-epimerase